MKKGMIPGTLGGAAAGLAAAWLLLTLSARAPAAVHGYTLGEYGGHVAVYTPGESRVPKQVTSIDVALLPSADRAQLREGIFVSDRRALASLLEDLSS